MDENNKQSTGGGEGSGNKMMMVGGIVVLAVVLIGGFVLTSNMNSQNTADRNISDGADSAMIEDVEGEAMEDAGDSMSQVIEVEGGAFYFKPNEVRVKAGESVTIKFSSVDMQHDFVIDDLDIRTEVLPGGQSEEITFVPEAPGEYEFYCSVASHRAQGMAGTLIVE